MTRTIDTGCTVRISHRFEDLGAHVELDGAIPIHPGDKVQVHGAPPCPPYGETLTARATATVFRAPWWARLWLTMTGDLAAAELLDVSFSDRRLS